MADKPNMLSGILGMKCPNCRKGPMFLRPGIFPLKDLMKMPERCPVCGQKMELEIGFYYGTGYVSYALSVGVCVASFIAWWIIVGFSLEDSRFFWWLGVNAVLLVLLQPPLMRLSRTLWLSWFVKYDPQWREHKLDEKTMDRIVPEQMGNW